MAGIGEGSHRERIRGGHPVFVERDLAVVEDDHDVVPVAIGDGTSVCRQPWTAGTVPANADLVVLDIDVRLTVRSLDKHLLRRYGGLDPNAIRCVVGRSAVGVVLK